MQQGLNEDLYHHVDEYRDRDDFSQRERLAIEFAERYALDHRRIGPEFIESLRAEYGDEEVVELAGLVAFSMGIGRAYAVLDIANECPVVH